MKKAYMKPQIMFEDFNLTTNIAADCEWKTNTPSANQCGLEFGDLTLFLDTVNGCIGDGKVESSGGDGQFGNICYHVFSTGENVFTS